MPKLVAKVKTDDVRRSDGRGAFGELVSSLDEGDLVRSMRRRKGYVRDIVRGNRMPMLPADVVSDVASACGYARRQVVLSMLEDMVSITLRKMEKVYGVKL